MLKYIFTEIFHRVRIILIGRAYTKGYFFIVGYRNTKSSIVKKGGKQVRLNIKITKIKMAEKELSITKLAKLLGLTYPHMAGVLRGSRGLSVRTLWQLAKVLDCSMEELIKEEE
jgi:DNA-binding Xre family transcriptional regulator